jgi:hypothetical protein
VKEGGLYLAACVERPGRSMLVTHAGLTGGLWKILGKPQDARAAALAINLAWGDVLHDDITRDGCMLGGATTDKAGVYWAEAGYELPHSWRGLRLPFNMAHGHSNEFDWYNNKWLIAKDEVTNRWRDGERRHTFIEVSGAKIIGTDPGLGTKANFNWSAYKTGGVASAPGPAVIDLKQQKAEEMFLRDAY